MPKVDIKAALQTDDAESKNRRNMARKATGALLGDFGFGDDFAIKSKLKVESIPYEKLRRRDINEFSETADISTLAESIRLYGLINPLSVVHHPDTDEYVISAGHRRYEAITRLRDLYPEDKKYDTVDCAVYEVTDDPFKLKQGLPYITKEQEEGIYRDSNLENRQLSYEDVAKQIRYIYKRLDDEAFLNNVVDDLHKQGLKFKETKQDKVKIIINILSTQQYAGWSRETIRKYTVIMDAGREDLIDQIVNLEIKVDAAYKQLVKETHKARNRKTTKITALRSAVSEFIEESKKRRYTKAEVEEIRKYIEELTAIVDLNTPKDPE